MYSINSLIRVEAGRQGETGLRKVVIDCSAWTQSYPDLSIALVAIRPGETEPYVPTGVTLSDGILTWIPDAVDTAIAGTGLLGIQGTDASEHVIKSAKTTYVVESAVDTPQGYVPAEPEESWLAHAEAVLQDMLDRLAAQSAGTITDWLEENITQETGYVIDTSLTVQGAAADAKAVGDTIGALLETVTYTMTASGDWRKGYYERTGGTYADRAYFMCTTELIDLGGVTHVSVQPPAGYNASLTLYDDTGFKAVVGRVDSRDFPDQAGVPQESDARPYTLLGIGIGRFNNNDAATYAADPTFTGTIEITVTRLRQSVTVDDTLTRQGVPADAKAAGDAIGAVGTRMTAAEAALTSVQAKTDHIQVTSETEYTALADNGRKNAANVYTAGYKIDDDTGEYVSAASSYRACETYFEIPAGAAIFNYIHDPAYTAANINYCFYDAEKTYLGASTIFKVTSANVHADTWEEHPGTFVTIPAGAAFYRLYDASGTFHSMVLSVSTETAVDIPDLVQLPLRGKTVLAFGDSIWGNDRTDGIADFLAEYTGATVRNGAIGGTRITDLRSSSYDSPDYVYFDGVKLVHALVTGDWTEQDAHISSISSAYVAAETLPMLKALDLSAVDVVTIAYGHNDISTSETAEQIKSALGTIVADLLGANPALRIVVLTPPWRMFSSGTVDGDDYTSTGGLTLRTLGDALIEKAKALHITYHDMLTDVSWCALTASRYLDSDKVHPNPEGNRVYAHVVAGKLRGMW